MLRGKSNRCRIAFTRAAFDLRAARITESEHLRDFVERFAGRVIDRAAEDAIIAHAAHLNEQSVAAADDERNVRLHAVVARRRKAKADGLRDD